MANADCIRNHEKISPKRQLFRRRSVGSDIQNNRHNNDKRLTWKKCISFRWNQFSNENSDKSRRHGNWNDGSKTFVIDEQNQTQKQGQQQQEEDSLNKIGGSCHGEQKFRTRRRSSVRNLLLSLTRTKSSENVTRAELPETSPKSIQKQTSSSLAGTPASITNTSNRNNFSLRHVPEITVKTLLNEEDIEDFLNGRKDCSNNSYGCNDKDKLISASTMKTTNRSKQNNNPKTRAIIYFTASWCKRKFIFRSVSNLMDGETERD